MTPINKPVVITIQDPREFDGDPYQVAQRAIRQLHALVALSAEILEPTDLMARNAELERQLAFGNELGDAGKEWPESPQGRNLADVREMLGMAEARLTLLEQAVAFNPKAR